MNRYSYRPTTFMLFVVSLLMGSLAAPVACRAQTNENLWDMAHGVIVTKDSGVLDFRPYTSPYSDFRSDVLNMFGGSFGQIEGSQNTLFQDLQPAGFVHFVNFRVRGIMQLNHFRLEAGGDGPDWGNERDFARFTLYYKDATGSWVPFFNFVPPHPEITATGPLEVTLDTPVVAQEFRAEFEQYPGGTDVLGPRIQSLQGFGTYVGTLDPLAPRLVLDRVIGTYWTFTYDWLNYLGGQPLGWGLSQYVSIRNVGNAPAYNINFTSGRYGRGTVYDALDYYYQPGYDVVFTFPAVSSMYPLYVFGSYGTSLNPGETVVTWLDYPISWQARNPLEPVSLGEAPIASGALLPLKTRGYYNDAAGTLYQFNGNVNNVPVNGSWDHWWDF